MNIDFVSYPRAMKETWSESQVVLQPPLSQKELRCAEEVAKELDLLTEKVGSCITCTVCSRSSHILTPVIQLFRLSKVHAVVITSLKIM